MEKVVYTNSKDEIRINRITLIKLIRTFGSKYGKEMKRLEPAKELAEIIAREVNSEFEELYRKINLWVQMQVETAEAREYWRDRRNEMLEELKELRK